MTKVWPLMFMMLVAALLNYKKYSNFQLWIIYARNDTELLHIPVKEGIA